MEKRMQNQNRKNDGAFFFSFFREGGDGVVITPRYLTDQIASVEIVRGTARVQIGTMRFLAMERDVFFVPNHCVYAVCSHNGEPLELRGVLFDSNIVTDDLCGFDRDLLYILSVCSAREMSTDPILSAGLREFLHHTLDELEDEWLEKEFCYRLRIRGIILHMMTRLLRSFAQQQNGTNAYKNVLRLRPALEHLNRDFQERIRLSDLSQTVSLAEDYFGKLFKICTGRTPLEYLNDVRLNYALALMLEDGAKQIQQIAKASGFSGRDYFTQTFREAMLVTPVEYRKQKNVPPIPEPSPKTDLNE
ncbi:MAG: helix-turn-helix domain-containing protein [Clostridia bacterium]|nr:helix-turn-helix domain-containing protein [Clostridia bacterium]